MNSLDEIAARAELAQGAWEDFQLGIATTRFALEEANNSAEDVKPMLDALRAVEALCDDPEHHETQGPHNGYVSVDNLRAAIREALGS